MVITQPAPFVVDNCSAEPPGGLSPGHRPPHSVDTFTRFSDDPSRREVPVVRLREHVSDDPLGYAVEVRVTQKLVGDDREVRAPYAMETTHDRLPSLSRLTVLQYEGMGFFSFSP